MPKHLLSRASLVALMLASVTLAAAAPALAQQIERGGGNGSDGLSGGRGGGGGGGFGLPGGGAPDGSPGGDEAGGHGGGYDPAFTDGRGGAVGGAISGGATLTQSYTGAAGAAGTGNGGGGGGTGLVLRGGGVTDTDNWFITGGEGGIGAAAIVPGWPSHGSGGGGTGLLVLDGGAITITSGGVTGGRGASSTVGMGAGGGAGLFLHGGGSILNKSFVLGGAGGAVAGGGTGGTGGAGLLANGGTITNELGILGGSGGDVTGGPGSGATAGTGGAGIAAWGAEIVNRAAIIGGSAGAPADGYSGRGGAGVILRDGAASSIVNWRMIQGGSQAFSSDVIDGGMGGSAIEVGSVGPGAATSVVTNKVTVTSGGTDIGMITGGAGGGGKVTGGDAGVGILFRGAGRLDNEGEVTGGMGGTGDGSGRGGHGAAAVVLQAGGTIVNSGLLQGGTGGGGGGRAAGGGAGAGVIAAGGAIENSGRIFGGTGGSTNWGTAGSGGGGIVSDGTAITNKAAGEISGGTGGLPSLGGGSIINGGAGVQATAGSIDNEGRISGGNGALPPSGPPVAMGVGGAGVQADGTTIINRGTIVGGNGTFALNGPSVFDGVGGAGITGSALTIDNGGTISGGLSGYSAARASAIVLTGGASRLTMGPAGKLEGGIDIAGGASLTLDQSANDTTIAGAITGGGSLIKAGAATVVLSAAATYSGGTTIREGVLVAQGNDPLGGGAVTLDGGTLRVGVGPSGLFLNNTLTINRRGGALDAGTAGIAVRSGISDGDGPGTLTIAGTATALSGWVVFSGHNSYASATHIAAGAGLIGMNEGSLSPNSDHIVDGTLNTGYFDTTLRSLSGAASGRVIAYGSNDTTLRLAMTSGTADFAGAILDGEFGGRVSVLKTGAGHQIFSGISSYTGNTTVDGGTLSVNGSITSSPLVTVNAGGTLGGSGTVGETVINAGGTLSPGNSIGTLTVQGNLTFAAGSTYAVEVSPLGSDRVNVSGTATPGGATVAATYAPGSYVTKRYTILTAGSVSGAFAGPVNTNLPTNFSVALKQDATSVHLDLTLNYVPGGPDPGGPNPGGPDPGGPNPGGPNPGGPDPGGPSPPRFGLGLTVNQAHVAGGLVNSFNTAGGIPLVFGALTPAGLSGASGEAATGIQATTIGVMSRFLGLMTDPYSNGRNASVTEMADLARGPRGVIVAELARWSAWASGYGGVQATGGNAAIGSHGTSTSIYGSAFGADYRLSPDTTIGFALGAAGTSYRLGQGLGGGSSDVFQIGLYGRHQIGAAYVAAALAYGWQDVTTERRFMGDRLTGRFTANAFSGRVEAGYRFAAGFAGLTPYAAGEVVNLSTAGYREQVTTGTGLFALDYAGRSVTAWRTELGLRADKAIRIGEAELTLRGRLAWAHTVNPSAMVSAAFTSLPASGFVVQGAREAPNALLTSAGAELKWANGWSAAATFEGSFSGRGSSYAGRGTLRYQW